MAGQVCLGKAWLKGTTALSFALLKDTLTLRILIYVTKPANE